MKFRFYYRNLKARFRDEKCEIAAILDGVKPGDLVADVGCNKGSYLLWMSRAAGRTGRVVAFEPQEGLAGYLREVTSRCGLANVTVESLAVSSEVGEAVLHVPGEGGDSPEASLSHEVPADAGSHVVVERTTLDCYFAAEGRRLSVLKVDVEGHELEVFEGARGRIERDSPLLVFECEQRHLTGGRTVRAVLSALSELGYGGSFIHRDRLIPVVDFDPAVHQSQAGPRFWDAPDYCNNFILHRS